MSSEQGAPDLTDRETAIAFYDDRYRQGYLEHYWPPSKRRRVFDVVTQLGLPETGTVLDFGCGNGLFTDVLQKALPGWAVYGSDISEVAVTKARARFPRCHFFTPSHPGDAPGRFDFLFTHHVLEHVDDVTAVFATMDALLSPSARMLHILPCGNSGSLEHRVCSWIRNGINERAGRKFFFEAEAHLRRLTTEQVSDLAARHGFVLERELYSNQHHGAIRWITDEKPDFIRSMFDPTRAKDRASATKLMGYRLWLLTLAYARISARRVESLVVPRGVTPRQYLATALEFAGYPVSKLISTYVERSAEREWRSSRSTRGGSEMYLYCVRSA